MIANNSPDTTRVMWVANFSHTWSSVMVSFMKIRSTEDAKLVGAASPSASIVEVHEMAMKDNVMMMRAVDELPLPAGKTVELKPGGYHVMLIDLVKPLATGDKVPVTLTIVGKDGRKSTLEVKAEVRAMGAPMKK